MKCLAALSSVLVLSAATLTAQTTLTADGAGSTYELIQSTGYGIEVPDCGHPGRHFSETFDSTLGRNVFVAHAHRDQDDDRCINSDRQRTELRGGGSSLQAAQGSTTVYRWKVKLASGFQASPNFTHIMQIKAYGNGCGSGAPIVTITPRNSSLEFDHIRTSGADRSASLSSFAGVWVEMYLRTVHSNSGSLDFSARRLSDGVTLMSYTASGKDTWDDGCGYNALKLGIYRSLTNRSYLRDEDVRFNDVCVARGTATCPSGIGTGPSPTVTPTPTPTHTPTPPTTRPTPTPTPTPDGSFTEFTPGGAAVSASTNDGNLPANTVDNSLATRWSANGDGQWIQYDLGVERMIAFVRVAAYNGNLRQNRFDLQVSNGGGIWTNVRTGAMTSGTTTNEEVFDFADVSARWVRYLGHGNTANTFNSVTEISIFAPAGGTLPPTPTPTATPTSAPSTPVDLTPAGAAVTASANDGNLPANTVDNDLATRWSANGDGHWIQYDLGVTRTVSSVSLAWYQGDVRRTTFDVLVSGSATGPWTTALLGRQSNGTTLGLEPHDFADVPGRYVRIVGHGNTTNAWNSLTETEIWGY